MRADTAAAAADTVVAAADAADGPGPAAVTETDPSSTPATRGTVGCEHLAGSAR